MKWIKCSDSLPPIARPVLVWDGDEVEKAALIDNYYEPGSGKLIWSYYFYMEWERVTHWAELPEPPTLWAKDE